MAKAFKKSVLVEAAEYDRLKQRNLREYQPDMSRLGRLQDQIHTILLNSHLSDQQKLALVAGPESQFNKLKSELGVLSGSASSARDVSMGDEDKSKSSTSINEQEADPLPSEKALVPLTWKDLQIPWPTVRKAKRLIEQLAQQPKIIRANEDGELVIQGKVVPGSNYKSLLSSLFSSKKGALKLTGINDLFSAMRLANISPDEISSRKMREAYEGEPLKTTRGEFGIQYGKGGVLSRGNKSKVPYQPLQDDEENADDEIDLYVRRPPAQRPNALDNLPVATIKRDSWSRKPIVRKQKGKGIIFLSNLYYNKL
jgi:hypothetical protein